MHLRRWKPSFGSPKLLSPCKAHGLSLSLGAVAQTVIAGERGSALMVKMGEASEALTLQKVDIQAKVLGHLASTRMTLTFFNPQARVLAGQPVGGRWPDVCARVGLHRLV